jgi:hypothetical protein
MRALSPPLLLAALTALFLFPYVFLGRSMIPLELLAIFQPWTDHARELWGTVSPVENPLLDSIQQYYPRRVYMTDALREGWLPLWNPNVYGGSPFLGIQQGAVLYPPAWALALLPPELQFGWSAFFHLTLAAIGSYLFFRRLGLRAAAGATGAVAFALNGFVVAWLAYPNVTQWTLCWLPLALYCWERGRAGELRWLAGSGAVLALSLLGGHGQSSAYVLLAWGAWAVFRSLVSGPGSLVRGPRSSVPGRRSLAGALFPAGLAVALSLGHLLPVLDYVQRTDRGQRVSWSGVQKTAMPPAQLWTFLLPRLFGDETIRFGQHPHWTPLSGRDRLAFVERTFYPGAAVLVLAAGAVGALSFRKARGERPQDPTTARGAKHLNTRSPECLNTNHLVLFGLVISTGAVLMALGTPLYWPLWRFFPGFGQFTAVARIVSIAAWGLACLAAVGVHRMCDADADTRRSAFRWTAGAAVVLALTALIGHFIYGGAAPEAAAQLLARAGRPSPEELANREFTLALVWLLAPALLAGLARRGPLKPAAAGALAAAVAAADLFAFGFGFNPAADTRLARTPTPEIETLRGRAEPSRFLSLGPKGQELDIRERMPSNLPSVWGLADQHGSDSFVSLPYRAWEDALKASSGEGWSWGRPGSPVLRSAGVRFYLTGSADLFPGLRPVVGTRVQEDPRTLPYARLHGNAQRLSRRELLELMARPDREPAVALTSAPDAPVFDGAATVTPFRARRINGNRLVLEGEAPEPGLLVVCEQFDPGWKARVDGKPARIFPADLLLLGIPLPAGAHAVELTYAPDTWRAGLFGTLIGLALLAGMLAAITAGRRADGSSLLAPTR